MYTHECVLRGWFCYGPRGQVLVALAFVSLAFSLGGALDPFVFCCGRIFWSATRRCGGTRDDSRWFGYYAFEGRRRSFAWCVVTSMDASDRGYLPAGRAGSVISGGGEKNLKSGAQVGCRPVYQFPSGGFYVDLFSEVASETDLRAVLVDWKGRHYATGMFFPLGSLPCSPHPGSRYFSSRNPRHK